MGRNNLVLTKIENPLTRQVTYSKRKDSILKKARELSILCETDVALMMFSPSGRLNTFASNGRIEDIFLRYLGPPEEHSQQGHITYEEYLTQSLEQLKCEGEMLEKMALQEELAQLIQQRQHATGKMRYYEPNVENINSVVEAGLYQEYLKSAIERIQLAKANLLGKQIMPETSENAEEAAVGMNGDASLANPSANLEPMRSPQREKPNEETSLPTGPHLTIDFIKAQKQWGISVEQDPEP